MKSNSQKIRKYAGLLGAVCGGLLISMPAMSQRAEAQQLPQRTQRPLQQRSQVNPCPSIYYEEPHNNQVLSPQGCPPNAFTRVQEAQGTLPVPTTPGPTTQVQTTPTPDQIRLGVGGEAPRTSTPGVNPCPGIFYEAPHNTQIPSPQGCPPNAFTQQQLQQQPGIPSSQVPVRPGMTRTQQQPLSQQQGMVGTQQQPGMIGTQPPLPEQQQPASTRIALADGRVNVRLINETGTEVTYQIVGDTAPRSLQGQSDEMLRDLQAPVTMTFYRADGGLIEATPQPSEEPGMMEVRLNEATDLARDTSTIRIQDDGTVFLN